MFLSSAVRGLLLLYSREGDDGSTECEVSGRVHKGASHSARDNRVALELDERVEGARACMLFTTARRRRREGCGG